MSVIVAQPGGLHRDADLAGSGFGHRPVIEDHGWPTKRALLRPLGRFPLV